MSHSPLHIIGLAAFDSNYLWLIHNEQTAWVVDPGDDVVVVNALKRLNLTLSGMLITHHHSDHVGGIRELSSRFPNAPVIGPMSERIQGLSADAIDGQRYELTGLSTAQAPLHALCMATPGHTLGHVAFYLDEHPSLDNTPRLFCGDTLFAAGCGRLFEGTPAQLLGSLEQLNALPAHTLAYCAHEYTVSNLRFAAAVEPHNLAVHARLASALALRAKECSTIPFVLGEERETNPFLRTKEAAVVQFVCEQLIETETDEVSVFAGLRHLKNHF